MPTRTRPPAAAVPDNAPVRRPRNRSEQQIAESVELKATIVRAATGVFAERGYTLTTLDAVAKMVGLTRPGILHHFASKEALFLAVLEQERRWAQERIDTPPSRGPLGPIRELAVFVGGDERAYTSLKLVHVLEGEGIAGNEAAASYTAERLSFVHREIVGRLRQCHELGELPAGLDELATLVAATINGLQKFWLVGALPDPRAAFQQFVDVLARQPRGAAKAAGRKRATR